MLIVWLGGIITIFFGWAVWQITSNPNFSKGKMSDVIMFVATFPSAVRTSFHQIQGNALISRNRFPSVNGLKMATKYVDSNYLLLPVYDKKEDQSVIKLMRIYDQKIIHTWKPNLNDINKIAGNQSTTNVGKHTTFFNHPLLSADGCIVFHVGGLLIKVNKNSDVIWALNGHFHHSLEYDASGNIWSPSVITPSKFFPRFLSWVSDDAIAEISPEGKLLFQKSVSQILTENGYKGLVFGMGIIESELIHLNDIQPALTSGKYWKKDDLLISLAHKSTVFLYRPSTNKIIWLKTGPWLNQHDVDFVDSTRVGVFGNDIVRMDLGYRLLGKNNEEYTYNFKTDKVETPYTALLKKAKLETYTEGRSDILPNGDLFVEDNNNNRLLRGNKNNVIWEYVDRVDQHFAAIITWSRFITKQEFEKLTFLQKDSTL